MAWMTSTTSMATRMSATGMAAPRFVGGARWALRPDDVDGDGLDVGRSPIAGHAWLDLDRVGRPRTAWWHLPNEFGTGIASRQLGDLPGTGGDGRLIGE